MRCRDFPLILAWLIFSFVMVGCQRDKGGGGRVSGRVSLEGATSHGGITVELFGSGSNEPIWAIQSSHSCIGFPYSPAAHFDWRLQQPVYGTTTDAGGSFSLSDVADGTYIVCARRDSFGWSAPIGVTVQGADVTVAPISLYRETIFINQSLQQNTTFEEDHHYVFNGIINVDVGVTLTINPGAVLRFAQDQRMIVKGTLVANGTPEKWIVWTCHSDTVISAHWYTVQFSSVATGEEAAAVLVCHRWGVPDASVEEFSQGTIPLIEDCRDTLDAEVHGTRVGGFGTLSVLDFARLFPMQYGAILLGKYFDDREVWDRFHCLDVTKRNIIREQLLVHWPRRDSYAARRRENWRYLKNLFDLVGMKPVPTQEESPSSTAFLLQCEEPYDAVKVAKRLAEFGVYVEWDMAEQILALPCHSGLATGQLDYMFGAFRGMINPCYVFRRKDPAEVS